MSQACFCMDNAHTWIRRQIQLRCVSGEQNIRHQKWNLLRQFPHEIEIRPNVRQSQIYYLHLIKQKPQNMQNRNHVIILTLPRIFYLKLVSATDFRFHEVEYQVETFLFENSHSDRVYELNTIQVSLLQFFFIPSKRFTHLEIWAHWFIY